MPPWSDNHIAYPHSDAAPTQQSSSWKPKPIATDPAQERISERRYFPLRYCPVTELMAGLGSAVRQEFGQLELPGLCRKSILFYCSEWISRVNKYSSVSILICPLRLIKFRMNYQWFSRWSTDSTLRRQSNYPRTPNQWSVSYQDLLLPTLISNTCQFCHGTANNISYLGNKSFGLWG